MALIFPPENEACFLDANILYLAAVPYGTVTAYCSALLKEIENGTRLGATVAGAVADAVHKVMFTELAATTGRSRAGLTAWAKKHPTALCSLQTAPAAAKLFASLPMNWLETDGDILLNAVNITAQHGLMTNDAIIVAAMRHYRIQHLITNDNDFDGIPGITVWKPR